MRKEYPRVRLARLMVVNMLTAILLSACPASDVLVALAYKISVLTLNLRGIHEVWEDGTHLAWRDRYIRIANWAGTLSDPPDIIGLQEVWLRKRFFAGGLNPGDYETLFLLVRELNEATGVHYRIAYGSSVSTAHGVNTLFAGKAVIYNSDRLVNETEALLRERGDDGTLEEVKGWEDWTVTGTHMRESHPCTEFRNGDQRFCNLVDDQPYLAYGYRTASGKWKLGPTASAYSLKGFPGEFVIEHNVHLEFDNYTASFDALRGTLSSGTSRLRDRTLTYPPIVHGDFNISKDDMETNETAPGGRLSDLRIVGYDSNDVVGVLVGKRSIFRAKFDPIVGSLIVPSPAPVAGLCAPGARLWSDHCGVFAELTSPIRTEASGSRSTSAPPG